MAWKLPTTLLLCFVFGTSGHLDEDKKTSLALKLNDFGYRLLVQLSQQEDSVGHNTVLGPTSLAGLLAMTLLGSVGDTHDEIARNVGFSEDILLNRQNHWDFGELLRVLAANGTSSRTVYADAIFVDAHTQIRSLYREFLQQVYHGDAVTVDFEEEQRTLSSINDWVKNHTQGAITDFLTKPLPAQSKAVLLSAHYFSGQWAHPFAVEYTREMPFHKQNGEVVNSEQMLNYGSFKYVYSHLQGFHMVQLPYNDSTTSMYILKPRFPKKQNLTDLLTRLDWAMIDHAISKMKHEEIVVRFPKMALRTRAELRQALKSLGIESMFVGGKANFALMVEGTANNKTEDKLIERLRNGDCEGLKEQLRSLNNPGLHVDKVIHDVKITINEYGTEAIAVSGGILARSAINFYADTPFLFFIKDDSSDLVTFSAIIKDASA